MAFLGFQKNTRNKTEQTTKQKLTLPKNTKSLLDTQNKNYKTTEATKHTNTTTPTTPKPNMQQNTPFSMLKHIQLFWVNFIFSTYILFFLQRLCFAYNTITIVF